MSRVGTASAVVFAYHDVGVRCLSVLLAYGVHVPLVVTHQDDPNDHDERRRQIQPGGRPREQIEASPSQGFCTNRYRH